MYSHVPEVVASRVTDDVLDAGHDVIQRSLVNPLVHRQLALVGPLDAQLLHQGLDGHALRV